MYLDVTLLTARTQSVSNGGQGELVFAADLKMSKIIIISQITRTWILFPYLFNRVWEITVNS